MPWKKIVAREWLKFIGTMIVSVVLGFIVTGTLDALGRIDGDDIWPDVILIFIAIIYAVRLTVWSIKQRKN